MLGGLLGVSAGLAIGAMLASGEAGGIRWAELLATEGMPLVLLAAPLCALLLSGVASWIPALLAARQDPAVTLQQE